MDSKIEIFSCEKAKGIDLVDYLGSLGHHPRKIIFQDYWYLSPFRIEKTASFKINRIKNVWFDHGIGEGGNIIDLAIKMFDCTVKEFLDSLTVSQQTFLQTSRTSFETVPRQASSIKILDTEPLHSLGLLHYLHERYIPLSIASEYCVEVRYQTNNRSYFAIGCKNDSGGYEMRNAYCKNGSAPKGITTIKKGCKKVAVFEGFFDFLSFQVFDSNHPKNEWDFCILNSLSFFEKSRSFLEQHADIHLFLDNDKAGQNCSRYALELNKKYVDESALYKNYKDLNEWLVMIGKKLNPPVFGHCSPP